jgi:hypothetical protein
MSLSSITTHPSLPTPPCAQTLHPATRLYSHKSQSHPPTPLYLQRTPTRRDNGAESERRTKCRDTGNVSIVLSDPQSVSKYTYIQRLCKTLKFFGGMFLGRRTTLILRLIPRTITPHILRLLVLVLLALVAEHLVEEAELCARGYEPCA